MYRHKKHTICQIVAIGLCFSIIKGIPLAIYMELSYTLRIRYIDIVNCISEIALLQ